MRLIVVKQSFFAPPGQYGRLVTRANRVISHNCYAMALVTLANFIYPDVSLSLKDHARQLVSKETAFYIIEVA